MSFCVPTEVVTSRLTLRPWRDDEGASLLSIVQRDDVNRYLFTGPRTAADIGPMLARRSTSVLQQAGDTVYRAVEETELHEIVGEVLLVLRSPDSRSAEFGAVFHPAHQGRGYAVEAGRALLHAGFAAGLHRIYARCDARNQPSIELMARLGMRREAHMIQNELVKGEWTDEVRCALLAAEMPTRPDTSA